MTTTLTFQTFCNSIFKSWYLSIFSCSLMAMFWSPGLAKSIICDTLSFACWYKLCLVAVLYNLICLNIEIPKDFIFVIFLDWLWCVCVRARVCVCVCVCTTCYFIGSDTSYAATRWHFLYWLLAKIEHVLTMYVILCFFITESTWWGIACHINRVFDGINWHSLFLSVT